MACGVWRDWHVTDSDSSLETKTPRVFWSPVWNKMEPVTTTTWVLKSSDNPDVVKRSTNTNDPSESESGWTSIRNLQDVCVWVYRRRWITAAYDPTWLFGFKIQGSPSGGGGWHNLYSLKEREKKKIQLIEKRTKRVKPQNQCTESKLYNKTYKDVKLNSENLFGTHDRFFWLGFSHTTISKTPRRIK